jgi:hypothetical protein
MAVIEKVEKDGGLVECLIDSTNIIKSEYNQSNKSLILTFKAGTQYKYLDVLHRDYVRFEVSESQGQIFNKTMKNYKFEKLDKIDATEIKERINEIKNGTV